MHFGKQLALTAYYWLSQPQRWWYCRQAIQGGQLPISILFYHRVADEKPNSWTISTGKFRKQIDFLRESFEIISLQEAQRRLETGQNRKPAVVITFDDGYADNCQFALPYLIEHQIPCTYFVSNYYLLSQEPFPHDRENGCYLKPNTKEEIQGLSKDGVDIGAHTFSHADLGKIHERNELWKEVIEPARELSQWIQKPVNYFAFPFGLPQNLNKLVIEMLQEEGFLGAVSAYGGYNFPSEKSYHLKRIHADPEMIRFKNWLSYDLRKLAADVEKFEEKKVSF
ncbi:MAG: polysaccharide deacetylase family protein [Pirellulaceae bacterium]|nr:polysaccharide deacetylase family protein [Pirellulaceae bacterium]